MGEIVKSSRIRFAMSKPEKPLARLATTKPVAANAAPVPITVRASMRSSSQPEMGPLTPTAIASVLGSQETLVWPHPNAFSKAPTNTGDVL